MEWEDIVNEETQNDYDRLSCGDHHVPSICTCSGWLQAESPFHAKNGPFGKWMIFRPTHKIDAAWESVKKEIVSGNLGVSAHVSTIVAVTGEQIEMFVDQ